MAINEERISLLERDVDNEQEWRREIEREMLDTKLPELTARFPDTRACAVARAVYDACAEKPETVILFGSRARGDFSPDSDIDLLIVIADNSITPQEYKRRSEAARSSAAHIYGCRMPIDLVHISSADFHDGRRARNHVAGQAVRDGYDINGDKVTYDNPEPTNMPDIRERIELARRNLIDMRVLVENPNSSQEAIGFHAQQAVENALKGWISALNDEYANRHDIAELAAIVRRHPGEADTTAAEHIDWLTEYAVRYRYRAAVVVIGDRAEFLEVVAETVDEIIRRIRELAEASGDDVSLPMSPDAGAATDN